MLRHTRTGRLYAHGSTQTARPALNDAVFYTRDAQTAFFRHGSAQTTRHNATQTWRSLCLDDVQCGEIYSIRGVYETAAAFHARRWNAAIRIQRIYRGHLGRRTAARRREAREAALSEEQRRRDFEGQREEARRQYERRRRTHPSSDADFCLLRRELDQWALDERRQLQQEDLEEADAISRRTELTNKCTRVAQMLERMHIAARKEAAAQRKLDFLSRASAPQKWIGKKTGVVLEVETPETRRWAQRQALYEALTASSDTADTRLSLLRQLLAESPPDLTTHIHHLISREVDFLQRGICTAGVRCRLENALFETFQASH